MPSRAGTVTRAETGPGFRSAAKDLVTGGFGLQLVAPASATRQLPRIDQVDGRHLSADGA